MATSTTSRSARDPGESGVPAERAPRREREEREVAGDPGEEEGTRGARAEREEHGQREAGAVDREGDELVLAVDPREGVAAAVVPVLAVDLPQRAARPPADDGVRDDDDLAAGGAERAQEDLVLPPGQLRWIAARGLPRLAREADAVAAGGQVLPGDRARSAPPA